MVVNFSKDSFSASSSEILHPCSLFFKFYVLLRGDPQKPDQSSFFPNCLRNVTKNDIILNHRSFVPKVIEKFYFICIHLLM